MPELWPSGPLVPPVPVNLGADSYTYIGVPGTRVAWAVVSGDWRNIVPGGLEPRERAVVSQRLKHPIDDLDRRHTDAAAVHLAVRLCGINSGIMGYRAVWRCSAVLLGSWGMIAGMMATSGLDPVTDPYWKICAAIYRWYVDNPETKAEDRPKRRNAFYQPIPGEPAFLFSTSDSDGRASVVSERESSRAFDNFKRKYDGLNLRP